MFHLKYHPHYFSHKLSQGVKELYWYTLINNLALSMVLIFEPIYLYSLGYSLRLIMGYYALVYIWYLLLIYFGARFASRQGYKHAILLSNFLYLLYWLSLFAIKTTPMLFWVAPFFLALQKSFFWPAYDADIALSSFKRQRGREVGVLFSLAQGVFILGPLLGGIISALLGFRGLFLVAGLLLIVANYPLFASGEIRFPVARFDFRMVRNMLRRYGSNFFGYWGYAEDLMLQSAWPVYMFILIGSVLSIGLVTTIASTIGIMLMLYVGRLTDRSSKTTLINHAAAFYGLTWIFRFLAIDPASVITYDVLTKTGKDFLVIPEQALTFERAAEENKGHALAYSVFYEMSLSVGKLLMAILAVLILGAGGSIFWVFAIAGILTFFYKFLR